MSAPYVPAQAKAQAHRDAMLSQAAALGDKPIYAVEAAVFALAPEFHLGKARGQDGRILSLTSKTCGVDMASLREGQRLVCTVTVDLFWG